MYTVRLLQCKLPINLSLQASLMEGTCLISHVAPCSAVQMRFMKLLLNKKKWSGMALRYKICLFAVKLFEDHSIKLDHAELLILNLYMYIMYVV